MAYSPADSPGICNATSLPNPTSRRNGRFKIGRHLGLNRACDCTRPCSSGSRSIDIVITIAFDIAIDILRAALGRSSSGGGSNRHFTMTRHARRIANTREVRERASDVACTLWLIERRSCKSVGIDLRLVKGAERFSISTVI